MASDLFLGIDGGATNSTALLVDEQDRVLKKNKGGALNYHVVGELRAKTALRALLDPFWKGKIRGNVTAVCGFAGLDSERDVKVYKRIVKHALPPGIDYRIVNDMKISIEAECPDEKRKIIVISGTGSSVYGENGRKSAKSVGWDYLFGDEGSSYSVGLKVLKSAMQSYDGRIQSTTLEKLVLKSMGAPSMDIASSKVYDIINRGGISMKTYVASFSSLLDEAIAKKDKIALAIRRDTCAELVQGVIAVGDRLHFKRASFCLGYMGSGWKIPGLRKQFEREIRKHFPKVRFSHLEVPGAWGAIEMAKNMSKR